MKGEDKGKEIVAFYVVGKENKWCRYEIDMAITVIIAGWWVVVVVELCVCMFLLCVSRNIWYSRLHVNSVMLK